MQLLILALFFLNSLVAKANSFSCNSVEGLQKLSTYIACQTTGNIGSCAGLATILTGQAMTTAAKKRILQPILSNKEALVDELALKMHRSWLRGRELSVTEARKKVDDLMKVLEQYRKKPNQFMGDMKIVEAERQALVRQLTEGWGKKIYDPSIRLVNGEFLNRAQDLTIEQYKKYAVNDSVIREEFRRAGLAWSEIEKRLTSKASMNTKFLQISNALTKDSLQKFPFLKPSDVMADSQVLTSHMLAQVTGNDSKIVARNVLASMAKSGVRSMVPGLPGIAFGALGFWSAGTPGACSTMDDKYINRQSVSTGIGLSSKCITAYQANPNIIRFLQEPEEKQLLKLKEPRICGYYKEFYGTYITRPSFKSLSCMGSGFTAEMKQPDGSVYTVKSLKHPDGSIKQINYVGHFNGPLRSGASYVTGVMQFDNEGLPTSGVTKDTVNVYREMKLYVTEASECCLSNDADAHACLAAFNAGGAAVKAGSASGSDQ